MPTTVEIETANAALVKAESKTTFAFPWHNLGMTKEKFSKLSRRRSVPNRD